MPKGTNTLIAVSGAAALALLTACTNNGDTADDTGISPADADLTVVTGVYPLEWLAQEIGGDQVAVIHASGANER